MVQASVTSNPGAPKTGFITYEAKDRIASIMLNRPEAANAQTPELLDDLDQAWRMAAEDPEVRVGILQANGKHFSSGHDIRAVGEDAESPQRWTLADVYQIEAKRFLEYSLRWRNVPKPSIAAVQSAFEIHQTGHGHAISESGLPIPMQLEAMKVEIWKQSGARPRSQGPPGSDGGHPRPGPR
jgi:1,4-dihydroxy-2-naphthoyl-CoA synthase